jgi:TRAP-type uncharacterized transport system substrate-binding protein
MKTAIHLAALFCMLLAGTARAQTLKVDWFTGGADGVALAAIQGLNQKLEEQLSQQRAEKAELKARLEKLEHIMTEKNGGGK